MLKTLLAVFLALILAAFIVLPDFRYTVWGYPQDEMNTDFRLAVQKIPHNVAFVVNSYVGHQVAAAMIKRLDEQIALIEAKQQATARRKAHEQTIAECQAERVWPPCK